MNKKPLTKRLWPGRVPPFVPEWMRKRIEVNLYHLHELMQQAGTIVQPGETVLDVGVGEGRFSEYFSHARYLGVDFGKGDAGWDYTALDVNGDVLHLPIASNSVDHVVCTQTLEHVRDPQQVIREIGRILKPGGSLFFAAPQSWEQHQKPHDYFRFTSFALDMMFRDAGLVPQFIQPMGGYFWFLSHQLQMLPFWVTQPPAGQRRSLMALIVSLILRIFFLLMIPLPLFYLDRLDHLKDATLGYTSRCIKASER